MSERGLDTAIREALATVDAEPPHPDDELLARLHAGALEEERADRVRDHLAGCPACTERALDLTEAPLGIEIGDAEVAAGVERTVARARVARRLAAMAPRTTPGWWRLAAAVLAVCCLGLAGYAVHLRGAAWSPRPIADVPVVDLLPPGALRGAASGVDGPTVPIDAGVPFQTLLLTPAAPTPAATAALRIADRDGRTVWQGSLRANADGSFALGLPAGFLAPGPYDLELVVDGGGPAQTVRYRLAIGEAP